MPSESPTSALDAASKAMIYEGMNLSQLGVAFRMDHRTIVEKLHGVEPSGKRRGVSTWRIYEVAPYLVKPMYDIESYIKKMNHNDLPKILSKEFWNGQRARQDYELKAGQLWHTSKVIEKVSELYKLVAMSARLASDNIERNTDLTDRQREAINGIMRGMLEDLQRKIVENFKEPAPDGNPAVTDDL